jgi:hypothetical protein
MKDATTTERARKMIKQLELQLEAENISSGKNSECQEIWR